MYSKTNPHTLSLPLGEELLALIFQDLSLGAIICFVESRHSVWSILSDRKVTRQQGTPFRS